MGRPYSPDLRKTALERLRAGEDIGDVASSTGVSRSTLRRWLNETGRQPDAWSEEEGNALLKVLYPGQPDPVDFIARVNRHKRHGRVKSLLENAVWLVAFVIVFAVGYGLIVPTESLVDLLVVVFTIYIAAAITLALFGRAWSLVAPFDWVLIHLYAAEKLIRTAPDDLHQTGWSVRRRLRRRRWNRCLRRAEKGMARRYVRGRDFATLAARQWDLAQRRAALADLMTSELLVHLNGPQAHGNAARLLRELIYQTLARQWSMSADRQSTETEATYVSPYSLARRAASGLRLAAGAALALALNVLQFTDRLSV